MTRIGENERITVGQSERGTVAALPPPQVGSALALASDIAARRPLARSAPGSRNADIIERPRTAAEQSAAADLSAAFTGSPESFLARIAMEMRRSNSSLRETGIQAGAAAADSAQKAREAAQAAAAKAAEEATGFLGLGDTFGIIAKVAAVVGAIAATVSSVVTGGAGAVVAVGLILMTFGGDLADAAVEAGIIPESMRDEFATALKLTGAIMVATASFGAGAAAITSVTLEATSEEIVKAATEAFDMSPEAQAALTIGLSVAVTVLAAVAGGAAGAGNAASNAGDVAADAGKTAGEIIVDATQTMSEVVDDAAKAVRNASRVVELGAKLVQAEANVFVAVANHDAAHSRADAQGATATRDAAYDEVDDQVEGLKSTLKAYGRAMKMARQAQEARGEALHAATQQRA